MSRLIFTQGFEFDRSLLDASSQEPYGCLIPIQPSASELERQRHRGRESKTFVLDFHPPTIPTINNCNIGDTHCINT